MPACRSDTSIRHPSPLSVRATPGQRGMVHWLSGMRLLGSDVAAPNRSRGQGGAPAAMRGRTTLAPARSGACLAGEGNSTTVSAGCSPPRRGDGKRRVRAGAQPYLGARTRQGSGDKMIDGVSPRSARPRGLLRPSTDRPWRQGLRRRWPQHICLPMGRARTSHLGQATSATGRSSTGASARSPRRTRVWRTRRASLGATAKVARLPPCRALTCW
jgi:hypothetical protein